MAQQPLTNRVTRDQLAAFLKDFRTIRQFEELFSAQEALPAALILAEEALVSAGTADATATQAVDAISALTDAIMAAALAPAPVDAAPVGASYVVLSADNALGNERVLTAGANITLTDGGAGGTITIAATGGGGGGAPTNATYIVQTADVSLTAERVATDTADITWDFATPAQAALNLTTTGVSAGTYNSVTVDTRGRVTGGTNVLIPSHGTAYVNFGATGGTRLTATVVDPDVSPSSLVLVTWGAVLATDDNDPEMDAIQFFATPGAGQFDVTAVCPNKFAGRCRINYTVS